MKKFTNFSFERLVLIWAFFICAGSSFSQSYFQQYLRYKITVSLNDRDFTLRGHEEIVYINRSPDTLTYLMFHLWPNAYKDKTTALARQLLENGDSKLYFSRESERGYIDSLQFKVDNRPVSWNYDPEHIDICRLSLEEPIFPGDSVTIETPFIVKIPDAKFSRLGHTGEAFFITQWYPKPAVYDAEGWHAMPYLDQGEFYSEFADFDVSITLPSNYVVAATGDMVSNEKEEQFLESRIAETKRHITEDTGADGGLNFPPSDPENKTVRYVQQRVHDFAWFADKRFYVLSDEIETPALKNKVRTWIFFTGKNFEHWKKGLEYIKAATLFYSEKLGDYPYRNVTAVDGTIMAGGGMEYPNITVIGDVSSDFELDMVITHEVGHNWFYGILASNERHYPFLDEGLNSFYELRYLRQRYPGNDLAAFIGRSQGFPLLGIKNIPAWKYHEITYYPALRSNRDQPLDLHSARYTESGYGGIIYGKSALAFDYLLHFLGEDDFDKGMRAYFTSFSFKHPGPKDVFGFLEASSGKDLSWFRKNIVSSQQRIDFKITRLRRQEDGSIRVRIKNRSRAEVPFFVQALKAGGIVDQKWIEGVRTSTWITMKGPADKIVIDPDGRMPDYLRKNNQSRTGGIFRRTEPLRFSFLSSFEDRTATVINFAPIIGFNVYNGFQAGLVLHNYGFIRKPFEWHVAPLYGTSSGDLNGNAEFAAHFFTPRFFREITLGVKAKRFGYESIPAAYRDRIEGDILSYSRIAPYIDLELKKKNERSKMSGHLRYTANLLFTDSVLIQEVTPVRTTRYSLVHDFTYQLKNDQLPDPYTITLNYQQAGSCGKISMTANYRISLNRKSSMEMRLFAGTFVSGSLAERSYYAFRAAGHNGWHDYLFDGNFLGRNEISGAGFSQFLEKDGAMKGWTPLGQSPYWLAAMNVRSPRIGRLPLRLFADIAACDGRSLLDDRFLWDFGINLSLWKDVIEVYYPFTMNQDSERAVRLNHPQWQEKIRFTFNIHKLEFKKILQSSFI